MGRMYTVLMDEVSVSVAKTLMRITAPADAVVVLHEFKVTQGIDEISQHLPRTA